MPLEPIRLLNLGDDAINSRYSIHFNTFGEKQEISKEDLIMLTLRACSITKIENNKIFTQIRLDNNFNVIDTLSKLKHICENEPIEFKIEFYNSQGESKYQQIYRIYFFDFKLDVLDYNTDTFLSCLNTDPLYVNVYMT